MNIVITGALGNISRHLTGLILAKGHNVTVISRDPGKAEAIRQLGAAPAIGSVRDPEFLTGTFTGADAVYTMVPPSYDATDLKNTMEETASVYATAIRQAGVRYVVNLSGIGAHRPEGHGPSSALWYAEQQLNKLEDVSVLHLRPGMFLTNMYGNIGMIRAGMLGNNFGAEVPIVMSHPHDIAAAAADALDQLSFKGKEIRYVVSDERNGSDLARVLGTAAGKPELPWVVFKDEDLQAAIMRNGFSEHMAANFVEMGKAVRSGAIWDDYRQSQAVTGNIKLEDFAIDFAKAYEAGSSR